MSRDHAEYLTQAVSVADLPALIDAHYPDARVYSGPKHRLKAVWRDGDGFTVGLRRSRDGWLWKDYKTDQGGNAFTWLVDIAGYEKRDAAELLLAEAGLSSGDPASYRRARPRIQAQRRAAARSAQTEAQQKAANVARDLALWSELAATSSSDYLTRKSLPAPHGVRYGHDARGAFMALRLFNEDGPVGLQRIYDDGSKKFTWGLKKTGAYTVVTATPDGLKVGGLPKRVKHLFVAEGFATAATVSLASREPVVVAFDKGNLDPVVSMLRRCVGPASRLSITIAADNDCWKADELHQGVAKGNPGSEAANYVALARSCQVVTPAFPPELHAANPTDFNDLHVLAGLDAVGRQLASAAAPCAQTAFANDRRQQDKRLRGIGASTGQYLPPIAELPAGVTLIRAPQGTGKTHAMQARVREARAAGKRVLYLTHRTSLANAAALRLALECYDAYTATELRQISSATMCVNSLYKLRRDDGTVEPFDVIILDESEQFVRALSGKHISNKRVNLDILETLIRRTGQFVCMDADLGVLTHLLLRHWRPHERYRYINHHYAVGAGKTVYVHNHPGAVYEAAAEKPSFVATNSRKESERFDAFLKHQGKTGELINGETSGEQHDLIANINTLTAQFDYLVASPSISTGTSIDHDAFERVCGVFYRNIGTPEDAVQAISRVRKAREYHVWLDPATTRDAIDLDARYGAAMEKELELLGIDVSSTHAPNDAYTAFKKKAEEIEQRSRSAYRLNILRLLVLQGYTIVMVDDRQSKHAKHYKALQTQAKDLGDKRYVETRLSAPILTDEEARALRAARQLSARGRYALDRHSLTRFYQVDAHDHDAVKAWLERDNRGEYRRQIERFETTLSPQQALVDLARRLLEQHNFTEDLPLLASQSQFYRRVLEVVGFAETVRGGEVRYQKEDETVQAFIAWIEENRSWLAGVVVLPEQDRLEANAVRYIGGWLRQVGLGHKRVGRNAKGLYMLDTDAVRETVEIAKKRGTFRLKTEVFSEAIVPTPPEHDKRLPEGAPAWAREVIGRFYAGDLRPDIATYVEDVLEMSFDKPSDRVECLEVVAREVGISTTA